MSHKEKRALKRKHRQDELIKQLERQGNDSMEPIPSPPARGRTYTVSIALPGSILDNAQSIELRSYLAGQIGRAAAIMNVDEVVVYDESASGTGGISGEFTGIGRHGNGNVQLARILQYMECPQYLRKLLFPVHRDLQYAGLLNPLDTPHHSRADEPSAYREGLVVNKAAKAGRSLVNCGMGVDVEVDKPLAPGTRVTVRMKKPGVHQGAKVRGVIVGSSTPRREDGIYWGYSVRLASSLSDVISGCLYKEPYDVTLGTSDKGESLEDLELSPFKHLLIVFGGIKGIEAALAADGSLETGEPRDIFDRYLNTCPDQGSRTIRTEEAILVTLAALRPKILAANNTG